MNTLTNAPAVLIRLPLEGRPQVRCDYGTDGDERRMQDWLGSRPDLLALVARALDLAEGKRAA
jgi:hypothetical protein